MNLTLKEVAKAVGAVNNIRQWEELEINNVQFDTRKATEGSLFVPLKGTNDGHDFIDSAIENGAVASFWSASLDQAPSGFPVLQVKDTLIALQQLAKYYLEKINPKVVGITGSNGKTTTKDMTEAVLKARYRVHKTQGNFNNHIGLPITILEMPSDTEVVILEMGMNHAGEIELLSNLAQPDIAVITMIGESHIEYLGSRAGIADAKMEITAGLKETGALIFPGEEPLLVEKTAKLKPAQLATFGMSEINDLYPVNVQTGMMETSFETNVAPLTECSIPVLGTYNVSNALAALTVGLKLEITIQEAAPFLAKFNLTKNRTEWVKGIHNSMILNDAYNANPTAMNAVLDNFSELKNEGKKIAVLGDMLELGSLSKEMHGSVAEHLNPQKIDEVYLYGEEMAVLFDKLLLIFPQERVHHYTKDKEQLIAELTEIIQPQDHILVKSSFGTNLLAVVTAIQSV